MSQPSPGSRERVWASGAPQLPHVVPSPPLVTNPSHSGAGAAGHLRDYTLDPYKGLRRPLGSPQLPSTCSELKRVGCPADSPAPSGAPLTTGCSQLLWAGTTHEPRLPLHLGDTPACQWGLGLPARRGPPDAASVAGRSCCHHPLQCTLCPQPGGCRLPSRSGPLEARVCLLPPPQTSGLGAWCRETWARIVYIFLITLAFTRAHWPLFTGEPAALPSPWRIKESSWRSFQGSCPTPRPHRVTAQAQWGDSARESRTPQELSDSTPGPLTSGPHRL